MQRSGGAQKSHNQNKFIPILVIIIIVALIAGGIWWFFLKDSNQINHIFGNDETPTKIYSKLTGLEISDDNINTAPTFCVQISNGSTDGARPQVGLREAAVVFEAIAESGITRFAAIYQEPPVMIGAIRSLRPYYLDWDTPFDCTIVHDGGSDEALAALAKGNHRNLDEDFQYMWKTDYINGDYRYWNNVFTSGQLLKEFNQKHNYQKSNPKVFPRLTPGQIADYLNQEDDTTTTANSIHISFTNLADYNVILKYDPATNTYQRFNEHNTNGTITEIPHQVYTCANNITNPPDGCTLKQVTPSAIAVMHVQENTMPDNYHENIQTIGQGKATIFQNGTVVKGTWQKQNQASQIVFRDENNTEISFTPGQLWIAAVPQFGSLRYE